MASYQASLEDHQEHNGDTVEGIPAEEHHQAQQSSAEEQVRMSPVLPAPCMLPSCTVRSMAEWLG